MIGVGVAVGVGVSDGVAGTGVKVARRVAVGQGVGVGVVWGRATDVGVGGWRMRPQPFSVKLTITASHTNAGHRLPDLANDPFSRICPGVDTSCAVCLAEELVPWLQLIAPSTQQIVAEERVKVKRPRTGLTRDPAAVIMGRPCE